MKLKRILTSFIAAAAVITTVSMTTFAVSDGEATYCFDNSNGIANWQTFGSVSETKFKITQTSEQAQNGNGCILISENVSSDISNKSGGAYITAESLGLKNFGGCTISMSVLACEGAETVCDEFSLFSEGMLWVNASASDISSKAWKEITLSIPENADNYQVGFTIPTYKQYMGNIVYIDDFVITRADGTKISNVGDFQPKVVSEGDTVSTGVNIALIILLVVLVLAIIGGIGFLISTAIKRFS